MAVVGLGEISMNQKCVQTCTYVVTYMTVYQYGQTYLNIPENVCWQFVVYA